MGDLIVSPPTPPERALATTRKPRSGKAIAKFQAKVHSEEFPDIFREFYKQLKIRVAKGDMEAMKMVADIAKLTGKNAGVTINNNVNQSNVQVANNGRDRRFESIVRQLDARDHTASESRTSDAGIQDAEFEDVNADKNA